MAPQPPMHRGQKATHRESPLEYEIVDATVKPDDAGEMGGCKVYTRAGKRYVQMTLVQARWFLDNGAIAPAGVGP